MVERRFEIERGDFTFDNAVSKLIEIDEIYNPNFFYIDAGYGEKTQKHDTITAA